MSPVSVPDQVSSTRTAEAPCLETVESAMKPWSGAVKGPATARGRGVGVAGGVSRLHLEGVRALGEPRVVLRRGARGEGSAVEAALEGGARLRRGETEARRGATYRPRRTGVDSRLRGCRVRRRWRSNGPTTACWRGVGVAGGVSRLHLEGVRALGG